MPRRPRIRAGVDHPAPRCEIPTLSVKNPKKMRQVVSSRFSGPCVPFPLHMIVHPSLTKSYLILKKWHVFMSWTYKTSYRINICRQIVAICSECLGVPRSLGATSFAGEGIVRPAPRHPGLRLPFRKANRPGDRVAARPRLPDVFPLARRRSGQAGRRRPPWVSGLRPWMCLGIQRGLRPWPWPCGGSPLPRLGDGGTLARDA